MEGKVSFGRFGTGAKLPFLGSFEAAIEPIGRLTFGARITSDGIDIDRPTIDAGGRGSVTVGAAGVNVGVEAEMTTHPDGGHDLKVSPVLGANGHDISMTDGGPTASFTIPLGKADVTAHPVTAAVDFANGAFHALERNLQAASDRFSSWLGSTNFGAGLYQTISGHP